MTRPGAPGHPARRPNARMLAGRLAVVVLLALIPLELTLSAEQKSLTFDEPVHLWAGYAYLREADYRVNPEHPPFAKLWAALPLVFFLDAKPPPRADPWRPAAQFEEAHRFVYRVNDGATIARAGRAAMLPLALGLALLVFVFARELFGFGAAVLVLFLCALEPNVLAHARLANNDLAITLFVVGTVFAFYLLCARFTVGRLLLAGTGLGLALATKFTALLLAPVLAGLALVRAFDPRELPLRVASFESVLRSRGQKLGLLAAGLVAIGAFGVVLLWGAYGFQYEAAPGGDEAFREAALAQDASGAWLEAAREHELLPEAYLSGLAQVLGTSRRYGFFLGETGHGWWHYFPVAFAIKTPLALLVLLGLVPFALRSRGTRAFGILALLLPVAVFFGAAVQSRFNIGLRHILPIYPFLFVLAGAVVPWAKEGARWRPFLVGALCVWYAFASVRAFPHYLAYFNELVGGPEHGYEYLVDSNLDWGQDLPGLKRYLDEHGIERVWLSYFGTASPTYHGIAYNPLPSFALFDAPPATAPSRFVAISATNLQGVYLEAAGFDPDILRPFRALEPIARIGYSIFVYELEEPLGGLE